MFVEPVLCPEDPDRGDRAADAGDNPAPGEAGGGQILIYRDGSLNLQVRLDGRTVWLTQRQLAELYQTTVPNINQHLKAIYEEGELAADATIKQHFIVQAEVIRHRADADKPNMGLTSWKNAPGGPPEALPPSAPTPPCRRKRRK